MFLLQVLEVDILGGLGRRSNLGSIGQDTAYVSNSACTCWRTCKTDNWNTTEKQNTAMLLHNHVTNVRHCSGQLANLHILVMTAR